jgi:beclin 1
MAGLTYTCGKCRQPLTLRTTSASESLQSLKESQYDLLASQISYGPDGEAAAFNSQNHTPLLGRKVVSVPATVLSRQSAQQKLFDSLSAGSEVDHPLCSDCAEAWAAYMGRTIESLKQERDQLIAHEKDAQARKEDLSKRNDTLVKDTKRLEIEEKDLVKQLLEAEQQHNDLEEEMRQLEQEERELEAEEAE